MKTLCCFVDSWVVPRANIIGPFNSQDLVVLAPHVQLTLHPLELALVTRHVRRWGTVRQETRAFECGDRRTRWWFQNVSECFRDLYLQPLLGIIKLLTKSDLYVSMVFKSR